jgi:hypothetical protein
VAVEEFRKSCTKKFLNEIGKQDLIDFMGILRKQPRNCGKTARPVSPVGLVIRTGLTSIRLTPCWGNILMTGSNRRGIAFSSLTSL